MKYQLHPPPETGVHSWLYGRATYLRREGLDQRATLGELRLHVASSTFRAGRNVLDREIVTAVGNAYRGTLKPGTPHRVSPGTISSQPRADFDGVAGWPAEMLLPRGEIKSKQLAHILNGSFQLVDLWSASPVRPPDCPAPRWALGQLFGLDELLCVGTSAAKFTAKSLREWTDDELLTEQLIVPNPLRKVTGTTKTGNESAHSRDATGQRRYIIVESDAGLGIDQQAQVLEHLRTVTKARLAAVVLSGGKSVHGWFRCDTVPISKLHHWFAYAANLGADPRLWLPEQFVRLPDGLRVNGARQSLIYLNPAP